VLKTSFDSDHYPVITTLDGELKESIIYESRWNLKKADWKKFKQEADKLVNIDQCTTSDVDELFQNICNQIYKCAKVAIPTTNPRPPKTHTLKYWNEVIKTAIQQKNQAFYKWKKSNVIEDLVEYKRLRAVAQRTIREEAKLSWQNFCEDLNDKDNISKVWKMATKMDGKRQKRSTADLVVNGEKITDDKEKANALGQHFAKVSSNENLEEPFSSIKKIIEHGIKEKIEINKKNDADAENVGINSPINFYELEAAINKSSRNSAPGEDQISYAMLKNLPRKSRAVLLTLFNMAWQQQKIPSKWKEATIIPFPKINKDPTDPGSYRPIALTSCIGKLLERIVVNRLNWQLERLGILNPDQSGFRAHHSTEDNIAKLQDAITKAMANKNKLLAVFVDFEKAYDMVWRTGILIKLREYGINGNIFAYIKNFLADTYILVKYNGQKSDKYQLQNGVTQGSVLSPLLFLVAINDINKKSQLENYVFADDAVLIKESRKTNLAVEAMQIALDDLYDWTKAWGFKVSTGKTVAILFNNKKNEEIQLTYNTSELPIVKEFKFLGIFFDENNSFNKHVDEIVIRCKSKLNLMRILSGKSWGSSKETQLKIYRTLIKPILLYGATATHESKAVEKLNQVQYRALMTASGAIRGTALSALQVHCGEKPLELSRLEHILKYTARIKYYANKNTSKLLMSHWTDNRQRQKKKKSIRNQIEEYWSEQHKVYETQMPSQLATWKNKKIKINLTLTEYTEMATDDTIITTAIENIIANSEEAMAIYTDAACNTEGQCGIGFHIINYDDDQKVSGEIRLNNEITILKAELFAVYYGILVADDMVNNRKIRLFSDSMNAIKALDSHDHKADIHNIKTCITNLVEVSNNDYEIVWIPGHRDVEGNIMADRLARCAAVHNEVDIIMPASLSENKKRIEKYITRLQQRTWTGGKSKYYNMRPIIEPTCQFTDTSRRKDVTITRLQLGKCGLNYYLHKMKKHADGYCTICRTKEDIPHYLLYCKGNPANEIRKWQQRNDSVLTLEEVLENKELQEIIYKHAKARKL
jgi:ribonuclease HI